MNLLGLIWLAIRHPQELKVSQNTHTHKEKKPILLIYFNHVSHRHTDPLSIIFFLEKIGFSEL
jgi:hypothetical protein